MVQSFDELLSELHTNSTTAEELDENNVIEINAKRQFIVSSNFDTVIAYEGDINSQIVTFKCINMYDGHELAECQFQELKWRNLSSGIEGTSKLNVTDVNYDRFYATWEVPSDLCTQAGAIEISLSFYDKDASGAVVYSWNTASYSGLSVAKSMDSVGFDFPARNEILFIDKDTKNIVAPEGYNNTICNYGDVGVANVYFLISRYLGKNNSFDIFGDNAKIFVYIIINGYRVAHEITTKKLYTTEILDRNYEGLVFLDWEVPPEITAGDYGAHDFQISIECRTQDDHGNITKRWFSNTYTNLKIGSSMFELDVEPGEPAMTVDIVNDLIDKYFISYNFVFDANEE